MKNHGLFSTLFIDTMRSEAEIDDAGRSRMATLVYSWRNSDRANRETLWNTFIKQALSYLQFVPPVRSDESGVYPLYEDYGYSNSIAVLFLIEPGADMNDVSVGRFWPGKLIAKLRERNLNWGILTDGETWRLYTLRTGKPFEEYAALNLAEALLQNDEKEYALFERCFHAESFTPESDEDRTHGVYTCRLDRDISASEKILEEKVKNPLLQQIDEVLQYLCNGFIAETPRKGDEYTEEERREIFESAVKLLYRCLFLFYAESRSLLPSQVEKKEIYARHSIQALCREAHRFRWGKRTDHGGYDLWKHLKGLIHAVNDGDPEYGIMGYNGGLFDDEQEKFLGKQQLRNDFLARALYLMAYVEPYESDPDKEYPIPYRDLEVRHLGEMYENILEFTVTLAEADRIRRRTKKGMEIHLASETTQQKEDGFIKKGDVFFGDSALERKQTGSYYTPESLVRFLNNKAVIQPLREWFANDYRERFDIFIKEAQTGHDIAVRRGAAQSAVALVKRLVTDIVLPFKLCDLAMGSGHFLVNAANQITDLVVSLLSEIPYVEGMVSPTTCEPNVWRRLITRHCLYGVDLNPLAVHLAKLSLWLNCFARDHRLTFLDHHLRCGNSLIGIRSLSELEKIPLRNKDVKRKTKNGTEQLELALSEELVEAFKRAARDMISITQVEEDDTDRQKEMHEEARTKRISPLTPLADLFTAYLMDGVIKPDDYRELFLRLSQGEAPVSVNELELYDKVNALAKRHHFFHWPLEFPDVFTDEKSGFDADTGNPPWDTLLPNSKEFFSAYDPNFRSYEKHQAKLITKALMKNNPTIAKKWEEYENKFSQQTRYFKEQSDSISTEKAHINTYKLFLGRFFALLRKGGRMGIVTPSGLYTDQGCQSLRELFFNESRIDCLYGFENRWPTVFTSVDGRFKFVLFCTEKGGQTDAFRCAFMEHDPERLTVIDMSALQLTFSQIKKLSANTLSIMEFDNQRDIDIAITIYQDRPLLGNYLKDNWKSAFQDEFNITHDTELFMTEEESSLSNATPLWEGKQIWILTNESTAPTKFMLRSNTKIKPTTQRTRVIYRSVASNTNERTFIPAIVPATFPTGNSLDACPLPPSIAVKIAVITGTFVIDWILRKKVTTNLNKFITAQLPILDIQNKDTSYIFELLLALGSRLICTSPIFSEIWLICYSEEWNKPVFWYDSKAPIDTYGPQHEQNIRRRLYEQATSLKPEWTPACGVYDRTADHRDTGDRAQLRAEIDAYVAHLYGLTRDEFAYILDTFPVLKRKEEQAFGEFMSKRKCLEEYERIKNVL